MAKYAVRIWVLLFLAAATVGCAPNSNGVLQPTLPWTRNVPGSSLSAGRNPWGAPRNNQAGLFSNPTQPNTSPQSQRQWTFLNDMLKRADAQESLAETQRREIQQLRQLQLAGRENERIKVLQDDERRRAALAKQYAEKQKELADREQKYRGHYEQLRNRADDLDINNRDLHAELAKSERERTLLQQELDLLREQLQDTTNQLSQARKIGRETSRQLDTLQVAASQRRGNASIRANRSGGRAIVAVPAQGLDVLQDGDLVRIRIPTEKMFMGGTAKLHQGATAYLDQVARILQQHYGDHISVVESHTDKHSVGGQWRNAHQLTAAQAMAVFEQLTARNIGPQQLSVIGHGGNHPLVSNGTAEGQAMNRRIEVVVYPETYIR